MNMEVQDGEVILVNKKGYPVSISPVLLHLLSVFLGHSGNVGGSWSRFEYLVALWEAQHKLISEEESLLHSKIICLPYQCPGKMKDKIRVPQTSSSNIVVNGTMASFSDVFLWNNDCLRLVQAKFTKEISNDSCVLLAIVDELKKNGLLTTSSKKEKYFVEYLAENWTNDSSDTSKNGMMASTEDDQIKKRRITYPVSNMAGLSFDAQDKPPEFEEVPLKETTDTTKTEELLGKIVVVFATNASKFDVKTNTPQESNTDHCEHFSIEQDDVDIYGTLNDRNRKRQIMLGHLKGEYTELRSEQITFEFQFYRKTSWMMLFSGRSLSGNHTNVIIV